MPCDKCGSDSSRLVYHWDRVMCIGHHNKRDGEHLHCLCNRCGWDWCRDVRGQSEPDAFERWLPWMVASTLVLCLALIGVAGWWVTVP